MHDFATNPEIQIKCHGPVRKLTNDLITRFCLFQIESLKICLTQSNTTLAAGVKLQGQRGKSCPLSHFKYPASRKKKVFQNASSTRQVMNMLNVCLENQLQKDFNVMLRFSASSRYISDRICKIHNSIAIEAIAFILRNKQYRVQLKISFIVGKSTC